MLQIRTGNSIESSIAFRLFEYVSLREKERGGGERESSARKINRESAMRLGDFLYCAYPDRATCR